MVLKSDARGADYRLKAQQALEAAERSGLAQVRLKHETAAGVWSDLADFEDRRSASARVTEARLFTRAEQAALQSDAEGSEP